MSGSKRGAIHRFAPLHGIHGVERCSGRTLGRIGADDGGRCGAAVLHRKAIDHHVDFRTRSDDHILSLQGCAIRDDDGGSGCGGTGHRDRAGRTRGRSAHSDVGTEGGDGGAIDPVGELPSQADCDGGVGHTVVGSNERDGGGAGLDGKAADQGNDFGPGGDGDGARAGGRSSGNGDCDGGKRGPVDGNGSRGDAATEGDSGGALREVSKRAVELDGERCALRGLSRSDRGERGYPGDYCEALGERGDLSSGGHGDVVNTGRGRRGDADVNGGVRGIGDGDGVDGDPGTDAGGGAALDEGGEVPQDAHVEGRITLMRGDRADAGDAGVARGDAKAVGQRGGFSRRCERDIDGSGCRSGGYGQDGGGVGGVSDGEAGDADGSAKGGDGGALGEVGGGADDGDAEAADALLTAIGSDAADGGIAGLDEEATVYHGRFHAGGGGDGGVSQRCNGTDGDIGGEVGCIGDGDRVSGYAAAEIYGGGALNEMSVLADDGDRGNGLALASVIGIHGEQNRSGGGDGEAVGDGGAFASGGQCDGVRVGGCGSRNVEDRCCVSSIGKSEGYYGDAAAEVGRGLAVGEVGIRADDGNRNTVLPLHTRVGGQAADGGGAGRDLIKISGGSGFRACGDRNRAVTEGGERVNGDAGGGVGSVRDGGGVNRYACAEVCNAGALNEVGEGSRDCHIGTG